MGAEDRENLLLNPREGAGLGMRPGDDGLEMKRTISGSSVQNYPSYPPRAAWQLLSLQAGLFFLPGQVPPPPPAPSSQDLGKRSEGHRGSSRGGTGKSSGEKDYEMRG